MAKSLIKNVKISGISCAVPDSCVKVEDFVNILGERKIKKFLRDVGVEQKFYSKNSKTIASDLCYVAARNLLQEKKIDKQEIDALIFISQKVDYDIGPMTAHVLQYRLGLSDATLAWDVNLGCSAYPYGLFMSSKMMDNNISKVLLLVGDDCPAPPAVPTHLNDLLFGSAGTATLLEFDCTVSEMQFEAKSYGEDFAALGGLTGHRLDYVNNPLVDFSAANMDGLKVFSFSVEKTSEVVAQFLRSVEKDVNDYEAFLLHQSNKSIIKMLATKLQIPKEKTPISLDKYGNTASATIPNLISCVYGDDGRSEVLPFLMVGYGIGMSISILDCKFSPKDVLPIIHTNETFEKGWEKALNARLDK